jgi:dethiobiotin synthetase
VIPRVYLVGTDTAAGKTTVACALLLAARRAGVAVVPFKPAASGPPGPHDDPHRLLAAANLPETEADAVCPFRFAEPVAPGVAHDPARFLAADGEPDGGPLATAQWALARLEQRHAASLTLIEGAGGLHVPMPGGTWQERWIEGLTRHTLVVARAGLGTVNHALLTIDALRERGCPPVGFVLSQSAARADPSRQTNSRILETRAELPCLGTLPFLGRPPTLPADDRWLSPSIWSLLLTLR